MIELEIKQNDKDQRLDRFLKKYFDKAPLSMIQKAPSAALAEGQTDEGEMGVTYAELDAYLDGAPLEAGKKERVDKLHRQSEHKRTGIAYYRKK